MLTLLQFFLNFLAVVAGLIIAGGLVLIALLAWILFHINSYKGGDM